MNNEISSHVALISHDALMSMIQSGSLVRVVVKVWLAHGKIEV